MPSSALTHQRNRTLAVLGTALVLLWGITVQGWGGSGLGLSDGRLPVTVGPHKIGGLPAGLGMWTWLQDETEGGDPERIVRRATATGLTHLYVRTGDSKQGFRSDFLDDLLPLAHQSGLRVYGWDFPTLADVDADIARALEAIEHRAPGGHRIDGFSADIESEAEGTQLSDGAPARYAKGLRAAVGPDEVLIATVPNPTDHFRRVFPYEVVVPSFDAVAPMIYWHHRDPGTDMARAASYLEPFGKVLLPIGQAYDGEPEGGPPGPPPPTQITAFVDAAEVAGARAVSFWSWQHASPEIWATLAGRAA